MGRITDMIGTSSPTLQIGLGGPRVKNTSGTMEVKNAADNAFAQARMLVAAITGDSIILNEQATGSGDSWIFTISRPGTGMTHDLEVIFPAGDPSVGQALTVASFAADVIQLQWTTIAGGAEKTVVDTTSLAFGTSSPVAMYTAPANAVELMFQIIIDTAFNGTPTMSIGITGTTSKYVSTNQVDLTAPAGTVFEIVPGVAAAGGTENVILTYSQGSASAGAARILGYYAVPS